MNDCESFLDILSECNCCERHKIDKPKKNTKWYCRDDPKEILTTDQLKDHKSWRAYVKYCFPCECKCRQFARDIVRECKMYKMEKCPVREEIHLKYKSIIENTTECSICFSKFNEVVVTTLDQCGHTFCKDCITKWFDNDQCIECPMCRTISWSNTLYTGTWNQVCKVYF